MLHVQTKNEKRDDDKETAITPITSQYTLTIIPFEPEEKPMISIRQAASTIMGASGPMIVSRGISVGGAFITSVMMARTANSGQETQNILAAGAWNSSAQRLVVGFCISFLSTQGVLMSKLFTQGEKTKLAHISQQAFVLSCLLSLPAGALLFFSESILNALGQPPEVSVLTQDFFRGFVWGIPALLCSVNQQHLAVSIKKPNLILLSGVLYTAPTLLLAYEFIFNRSLGFRGLGYANTIGAYVSAGGMSLFYGFHPQFKEFKLFNPAFAGACATLKQLTKMGFPYAIQMSAELLSIAGITGAIGLLWGTQRLAASQAAIQYIFLWLVPISNAANVTGNLVSHEIGDNRLDNAGRLGNTALVLSSGLSLLFFVVSLGIPELMVKPFINNTDAEANDILALAIPLLWIVNATQVLDALRLVSAACVRGLPLHDTKTSLYASVASNLIVALPLGYLLGSVFSLEAAGMFLARLAGIGVVGTPWLLKKWFNDSKPVVENPVSWKEWGKSKMAFFTCCFKRRERIIEDDLRKPLRFET